MGTERKGPKELQRGKMQYIRKSRDEGGHYDWKTKMKVVANYLATGNLALSARMEDVNELTARNWRKMEWWQEAISDMQLQESVATNKTLQKLRDKALEVVGDRLENGNYQYDPKTGRVERVPVNARDAHKIATDFIDKHQFIEDRIRRMNSQEEAKKVDHLKKIADAFAALAQGKPIETVEDGDVDVSSEEAGSPEVSSDD